jgi:hypothetical protein
MAQGGGGDLGVDVLIIGGGLQACYLADALHPRFSVCVVDDPALPVEALEADGLLAAGYDGNDVARIQPARRAASFWRLWAIDNGLDPDAVPVLRTVPPERERATTALWSDATLPFEATEDLPEALRGGLAERVTTFRTPNDVVLSPAAVLDGLRRRIDERVVTASVASFSTFTDEVIDLVELDVDGRLVPVVARFVVLAADVGNGELLRRLASRFGDPSRRRSALAAVRDCQANVRQQVVALRGQLPLVAGRFGDLWITAHPSPSGDPSAVVWLVSPAPDDRATTSGPDDVRFDVPVDSAVIGAVVEQLFGLSPWLFRRAHRLQWSAWGRRRTQHPMLAATDRAAVGQPVPARLDALGLEGFLALWPSHPAYAMVLGDVAAERIGAHLGTSAAFSEGLEPRDLRTGPLRPVADRWNDDRTIWLEWDVFAESHDVKLA